MGEDLEELLSIPGGLGASSFDCLPRGRGLLEDLEGYCGSEFRSGDPPEMTERGEVLGSVTGADAALILMEGEIED